MLLLLRQFPNFNISFATVISSDKFSYYHPSLDHCGNQVHLNTNLLFTTIQDQFVVRPRNITSRHLTMCYRGRSSAPPEPSRKKRKYIVTKHSLGNVAYANCEIPRRCS